MRFLFFCKCYIYILRGLVSSTVCRIKMKSANSTVSCASLDLYIAILAESSSPGILDEPVILSLMSIMTISYHSYFMVQIVLAAGVCVLLTASAVIVNTVIVVIYVISLNCCGDWVDINHIFHLLFSSVPLVILPSHMSTTVVPTIVVPARLVLPLIGTAALSLHSSSIVIDDPVKVGGRPSTVTPESPPSTTIVIEVVIIGTVHKVLLGKIIVHGIGLLPEACINYCYGGKGCAGSTLFLIFHRRNSALSNPTPFSRRFSSHFFKLLHKSRIFNVLKLCCVVVSGHAESTSDKELLMCQIVEFCHLS